MQLHLLLASGEWCLFYLYEVSWIKTWIKNNFRGTSWLIITNYSPNWYSIQTLCLIGAWHVLTDANVTWSVNNIPQLLLMCTSTLKKNIWIYLILLCTPLPHDWSNSINSLFPNTELFLVQLKYFIYTGLHN